MVSGFEGFLNGVAVSVFALKREAMWSAEAEGAGLNLAEAHQLRHRNAVIMLQDVVEKRKWTISPNKGLVGGNLTTLKRR